MRQPDVRDSRGGWPLGALAFAVSILGCADDSARTTAPASTAAASTVASSGSLESVRKNTATKSLRRVGMKRYRRAKAIADMRKQLGEVARAAAMAYAHTATDAGNATARALCGSAEPVPASVPRWDKPHVPSGDAGADFQTGDDKHGWKCLTHAPKTAMRFQLTYVQGGKYKSVERGGADPGPKGFEVAAEFDSDENGKTALLAMTGRVGDNGKVTISKQVFESDKEE